MVLTVQLFTRYKVITSILLFFFQSDTHLIGEKVLFIHCKHGYGSMNSYIKDCNFRKLMAQRNWCSVKRVIFNPLIDFERLVRFERLTCAAQEVLNKIRTYKDFRLDQQYFSLKLLLIVHGIGFGHTTSTSFTFR